MHNHKVVKDGDYQPKFHLPALSPMVQHCQACTCLVVLTASPSFSRRGREPSLCSHSQKKQTSSKAKPVWYVGMNLIAIGRNTSTLRVKALPLNAKSNFPIQIRGRQQIHCWLGKQICNSSSHKCHWQNTSSKALKVIIHYSQEENYIFIPLQLK